jgi:hypothetical protein
MVAATQETELGEAKARNGKGRHEKRDCRGGLISTSVSGFAMMTDKWTREV